MPVIFNEENKALHEKRLLEVGLELIICSGIKSLTIDNITRKAGFSKSTFYTFFNSKEEFLYKIAMHKRAQVKEHLNCFASQKKKFDRDTAKEFFIMLCLSETNIYPYISKDDYEYLKAKNPELYRINPKSDEENSTFLLSLMDTDNECNWKLFSNYIKAIVAVTMNSEYLYQDIYKETIALMIDGLIDFIFNKSE